MKEPTELQKQQYKRFTEIMATGKQRYIQATGNHQGYRAGIKGQDYLTDEERTEASFLLHEMFVIPGNDRNVINSQKKPEFTS